MTQEQREGALVLQLRKPSLLGWPRSNHWIREKVWWTPEIWVGDDWYLWTQLYSIIHRTWDEQDQENSVLLFFNFFFGWGRHEYLIHMHLRWNPAGSQTSCALKHRFGWSLWAETGVQLVASPSPFPSPSLAVASAPPLWQSGDHEGTGGCWLEQAQCSEVCYGDDSWGCLSRDAWVSARGLGHPSGWLAWPRTWACGQPGRKEAWPPSCPPHNWESQPRAPSTFQPLPPLHCPNSLFILKYAARPGLPSPFPQDRLHGYVPTLSSLEFPWSHFLLKTPHHGRREAMITYLPPPGEPLPSGRIGRTSLPYNFVLMQQN